MDNPLVPRPRRLPRSWTPIVLWVGLIVLWVLFYGFFSRPLAPDEEQTFGRWAFALRGWGSVLLMGVVVALTVFFVQRRMRRWQEVFNQGVALVMTGDHRGALEVFERCLGSARNTQRHACLQNIAFCSLWLGKLEQAISALDVLQKEVGLQGVTVDLMATAYAFQGDLETTKRWLAEGRKRAKDLPAAYGLLPEALVLCREEHYGAALKTIGDHWPEAEVTGGRYLKMVRLLRAYALHRMDPQKSEAEVFEALAGVKPFLPGEFDAMAQGWPALREFLVERKLTDAS